MTDIVYMKYTFRPVAGTKNRFYCKRLKVTVEAHPHPRKTHQGELLWSAYRTGANGTTEWYSRPTGVRKTFTGAQCCIESLVQSDWLVGTDDNI